MKVHHRRHVEAVALVETSLEEVGMESTAMDAAVTDRTIEETEKECRGEGEEERHGEGEEERHGEGEEERHGEGEEERHGEGEEEHVGEEECEEEEDDDHEEDVAGKKKKKKKKRRKKKKKGEGGEKNKVFRAALHSLSSNSADALWVRLDNCMIGDDELKSLCDALRKNTHILSLDLSDNDFTDAGAHALSKCLMEGAAPDLIELLMRNNDIGEEGMEAIAELARARKVLKVDVSSTQRIQVMTDVTGMHHDNSSTAGYSNLVQNIFQMGGDDEIDLEEEENNNMSNMEEECIFLWDEVKTLISDSDTFDTSRLSKITETFFALNASLTAELTTCRLPLLKDTELSDLQCFLANAIDNLHVIDACLDINVAGSSGFLTPFSKETPVARVGSHRVLAATLAATALSADCPSISREFLKNNIIRKVISLCIRFPYCNALHAAALKIASVSVSEQSGPVQLWRQYLETSTGAPSEDIFKPIVQTIDTSKDKTPGTKPLTGFCVEFMSKVVQGMHHHPKGAPQPWQTELEQHLTSISGWKETCVGDESPLQSIIQVQDQHLGGPPPERGLLSAGMGMLDDSSQISGTQLLALLRGLNLG